MESAAVLHSTRDLRDLWLLRVLVHGGAAQPFLKEAEQEERAALLKRLRVNVPLRDDDEYRRRLIQRFQRRLMHLERHASRFTHAPALRQNLELLANEFAFSPAECALLACAVLRQADEVLGSVMSRVPSCEGQLRFRRLAVFLGVELTSLEQALSPHGLLAKSGLLDMLRLRATGRILALTDERWCDLAFEPLSSREELLSRFVPISKPTRLSEADYMHLSDHVALLTSLVKESLESRRQGVNILLYGLPGTGKTQLARLLAAQASAPLFEVPIEGDGDEPMLRAGERLAAVARSQLLLSHSRALLLFDEVEAIFNDGSHFFGKPSTAEQGKAWVNNLLESTPIPTIWVANEIWGMDAAFVRRFDMALEVMPPPRSQRVRYLSRMCGDRLDCREIERLAHSDAVTPAVIERALSVAQRVSPSRVGFASTVERVLDGTLRAQGHKSIRETLRDSSDTADYDPTLANADHDLSSLADALARSASGRLCLHGPPGTGKTGFGRWLARKLDLPLVVKRASDLQGAYVGVTERNLAKVFAAAEREGALLQVDEVDTFLRDRTRARASWEVSQTNEFLTQLEAFGGIVVCTTNFLSELDSAAIRRFDLKIGFGYLRAEQAFRLLCESLSSLGIEPADGANLRSKLARMDSLTPGDFALVTRTQSLFPESDQHSFMTALRAEVVARTPLKTRIGFV